MISSEDDEAVGDSGDANIDEIELEEEDEDSLHEDDNEENEEMWALLDPFLKENGLQQWTHSILGILNTPQGAHRNATGFAYAEPSRENSTVGGTRGLKRIQCAVCCTSLC